VENAGVLFMFVFNLFSWQRKFTRITREYGVRTLRFQVLFQPIKRLKFLRLQNIATIWTLDLFIALVFSMLDIILIGEGRDNLHEFGV